MEETPRNSLLEVWDTMDTDCKLDAELEQAKIAFARSEPPV